MPDRLLLDTNVLILLVVGTWDRSRISEFRRTAAFSTSDFDLLQLELRRYQQLITVPAVLTEVSNLMGNTFHSIIGPTIEAVCAPLQERSPGKNRVMADTVFDRLGFADTSILLGVEDGTTILTDDVSLYVEALYRGLDAVNFNHLRSIGR